MCDEHLNQLDDFDQTSSLNYTASDLLEMQHHQQPHQPNKDSSFVEPLKDEYTPTEKFIYIFKPEWDRNFECFDDPIIRCFQYFHLRKKSDRSLLNKALGALFFLASTVITCKANINLFINDLQVVSRIENISAISLFLLALGFDYMGRWFTLVGVMLSLVAQFPKRFLYRKRPFMTNRALRSGKLDTSSFPSRAVTCAVVYAFSGIMAYNYQMNVLYNDPTYGCGIVASIFIIIGAFLASSFARIHLGAHYPSDCIGGLVQGLFVSALSWLLFKIPNIFGCPSCDNNLCYPTLYGNIGQYMNNANFHPQNIGLSIVITVIAGILLVLSNCPPLVFWNKSAPIFGTFCACILAEVIMICPKGGAKGLGQPSSLVFDDYLYASLAAAAYLGLSAAAAKLNKKTRKLKIIKSTVCNLLVYLFFVIGFLALIVRIRLGINDNPY